RSSGEGSAGGGFVGALKPRPAGRGWCRAVVDGEVCEAGRSSPTRRSRGGVGGLRGGVAGGEVRRQRQRRVRVCSVTALLPDGDVPEVRGGDAQQRGERDLAELEGPCGEPRCASSRRVLQRPENPSTGTPSHA